MYKAIATVGTLLLNLGELSVEKPETTSENSSNLSKPDLENSSNLSKPDLEISSNLSGGDLDQGSISGSPLSDTGSAQRRLCEALADAAADCSPGSDEGNTDDNEFIRVGSEDSLLSSPEVIDFDDDPKCGVEASARWENSDQTTSDSDLATKNNEVCANDSDHLAENSEESTKGSDQSTQNPDDDTKPCEGPSNRPDESTKDSDNVAEAAENSSECVGKTEGGKSGRRRSSGNVDLHWAITFEQFLASVLTEPLLVEYFEEETNIEEIINTVKTEGVRDFVRDPRRSISVQ